MLISKAVEARATRQHAFGRKINKPMGTEFTQLEYEKRVQEVMVDMGTHSDSVTWGLTEDPLIYY